MRLGSRRRLSCCMCQMCGSQLKRGNRYLLAFPILKIKGCISVLPFIEDKALSERSVSKLL